MNYVQMAEKFLPVILELLPKYQTGRPRDDELDLPIIQALLYRLNNNCKWRDLPANYPVWQTVYSRFKVWNQAEIWDKALQQLTQLYADKEWVSIDATLVRAASLANGSKYCPQQEQGFGRTTGGYTSKIHLVVDSLGNPLNFTITKGNRHDIKEAPALLEKSCAEITHYALADGGYTSKDLRQSLLAVGITPVIPNRSNAVEIHEFDRDMYKARHVIENAFNKLKQFRAIAYRTCKTLLSYQSFVAMACLVLWFRII